MKKRARRFNSLILYGMFGFIGIAVVSATFATVHHPRVQTGLDVLVSQKFRSLYGKRVGLVTNHSAIDGQGKWIVDHFMDYSDSERSDFIRLAAIFAPEHGLRGDLDRRFGSGKDPKTGVMIYSLYGENLRPTDEMVRDLDVLVFDIQDIGVRYYTYISTMAWTMQAAARNQVEFMVLDRPNLTGAHRVQGAVPLKEDTDRHTSIYPIPTRHGRTVGELARIFNQDFKIGADLTVVSMKNDRRSMYFDETGLPWVNPSPNIRDMESALLYVGLGILESTNLSVGRGTETPFKVYGAPWIDADRWLRKIRQAGELSGIAVETTEFTPTSSIYRNRKCQGLRVKVIDRNSYDGFKAAIVFMQALHSLYPDRYNVASIGSMAGDRSLPSSIRSGEDPSKILARWKAQAESIGWVEK